MFITAVIFDQTTMAQEQKSLVKLRRMLKFWRWNEKLPPQPVYRPPPPSRQEKSEKGGLGFTVANRVWRPRNFSRNVWKIIWLAVTRRQERMIYHYIM